MKLEINTLTDKCYEGCDGFDVTKGPGGLKCSKLWLCRYGADAIMRELIKRFEDEEARAYEKPSGLKEHATWNKAIRIVEEYIDES